MPLSPIACSWAEVCLDASSAIFILLLPTSQQSSNQVSRCFVGNINSYLHWLPAVEQLSIWMLCQQFSLSPSSLARSQAAFCLDASPKIFIHTNSQQSRRQVPDASSEIFLPSFTDSPSQADKCVDALLAIFVPPSLIASSWCLSPHVPESLATR